MREQRREAHARCAAYLFLAPVAVDDYLVEALELAYVFARERTQLPGDALLEVVAAAELAHAYEQALVANAAAPREGERHIEHVAPRRPVLVFVGQCSFAQW